MQKQAVVNTDFNQLQYLAAEELQTFQFIKLKEQLSWLELKSPFYQKIFGKNGISELEITNLHDFQKIPFTTKEDLQLNSDDFVCVPQDEIIDYCSTSGTLGKPIVIKLAEKDLERLALNESLGLEIAGVKKSDVVLLTTTIDKQFMAGLAYFSGIRKLGAGVIRNGSGSPAFQWETIASLKPSVIIAVPSFLLKLTDYANENGIDLKNCSLKKAICIGESVRNPDLSLSQLGKRILEAWPIELHSTYASTEMQTCFTECEAGQGGHLLPGLLYPEIIDENGQVLPAGSTGELVITTLGVEGMPLLRYKTGDICSLNNSQCQCGRLSPRITPISGRKSQMLKVKGTTIYPAMIYNVLDGFDLIAAYLLEVFTDNAGNDELKITISMVENADQNIVHQIEEKLHSAVRIKIYIDLKSTEEINNIQSGNESRKTIKFIDHRKPS